MAHPNADINAILEKIVDTLGKGWPHSSKQAIRFQELLDYLKHYKPNPSDYELVVPFCMMLPYIEANTYPEEMEENVRLSFSQAALDGINEGLGTFKHQAMQIHSRDSRNEIW